MIEVDNSAQLHYLLGKEYYSSSSKKLAREAYKKAYELDNNDGTILKDMALTLLEEKNYNEAYEMINQSIQQCLKDECSRKNTLLYAYASKAVIAKKLKKEDESLGCLIKAYEYADDYAFEIHKFPLATIITEASALSFLHNVGLYSQTICLELIAIFYEIGKKTYKQIIDAEMKNHSLSFFNKLKTHNLNVLSSTRNESFFITKNNLAKSYYYGYRGIYILSSVANVGIPYISYAELLDVDIDNKGKEVVLIKNNSEIKLAISKEHSLLLTNILNKMNDKNKELLKLVSEE